MKHYENLTIKDLPESEIEIEAEIPYETLSTYRTKALQKISAEASVPGFRKGHVPEKILVEKVGEMHLLQDAAEGAIEAVLPELMKESKKRFLGRPEVSITKIAAGNPLQFKVKVSVMPEFSLPDYKKIAAAENSKKPEEISVTEKEVEGFIENIRKSFAENTSKTSQVSPEKTAEALPELTDEFVGKLGNFKTVAEFTEKVKENILEDKRLRAREKKRLEIAQSIMSETKVAVPKILIESEIAKLLARFQDDISRMGLAFEEYLKQAKKTEGELRKEWRPEAEKRAKLSMVLDAISAAEKIEAPQAEIDHEVKHLLEQYKDADPERAHAYIANILTNEKVFRFLEDQK